MEFKKPSFGFDSKNMPGEFYTKGEDGNLERNLNYTQTDLDYVEADLASATTPERTEALLKKKAEILEFLGNKNRDLN